MKLKTTFIALSILTTAVIADPNQRKGERYERMADKLNLTDTQQAQLEEVMQNRQAKLKEAMDQINNETEVQLSSFLTEEQVEKVQKRMSKKGKAKKMRRAHKKMHENDEF